MTKIFSFIIATALVMVSFKSYSQDSTNYQEDFAPFLAKTIKKASLKTDADSSSETKLILPIGSQLYAFSENDVEGYIKVIDIRTNKLGYVRKTTIKKIKDLPLSQSNSFQEDGQSSSASPEVEIKNESSLTITLIVGSKYFSLSPHTTSTETIESGELTYTASAPSVIPLSGKHNFKMGSKYTWEFFVRTTYR